MRYKIKITKIEEKTVTEEGQWCILEQRPWKENELEKEGSVHYGDFKEFLKDNPLKEIRGYSPSREALKEFETEMLSQTVEELDFAAVVKAINGL